jgi:RNA polymerase sigma factor (sigma-70 family)
MNSMDMALGCRQSRTVERNAVGRAPADIGAMCDAAAGDLTAYRAGDQAALDRLVRRLTPMLWHVVRAYGLDTATAEDVVQSTWLTLVRSGDRIADPQAVVKWLTVTARREAWRQARGAIRVVYTDVEVIDLREPAESGPEAVAIRVGTAEVLWRAVSRLDQRCQRMLRIVAFADRPNYEAVSKALDMPVGSIGPTRSRCLAKLRVLLETSGWRRS